MKIIMATNNKNKVREFSQILKDTDLEPISQQEAGISVEVDEDGDTFLENAVKKAVETYRVAGMPTIADDSGLMVDALGGEPGVYSARYAGIGAGDKACIDKLLLNMQGKTDRTARFVSVIAVAFSENDVVTATGVCEGLITDTPKGENGFGYDPVFYIPAFCKTFAELTGEEKNSISHRGQALLALRKKLLLRNKEAQK